MMNAKILDTPTSTDEQTDKLENLERSGWESLLDSSSDEETDSKEPQTSDDKENKDPKSSTDNTKTPTEGPRFLENDKKSSNDDQRSKTSGTLPVSSRSIINPDGTDTIILSVTYARNNIAAAYYNLTTSELFIMDDTVEDELKFNIIKVIYKQIQPTHVLILSGTSNAFISAIKKLTIQDQLDCSNQSLSSNSTRLNRAVGATMKFLSKSDNTYENCITRVKWLKLECEPENISNAERIIYLNSMLNFKSKLMIQALGTLLRYLDDNWNKISLNPTGQAQFVAINTIKLNDLVMIEEETYKILNIVQARYHPSLFKHETVMKDQGMSLFTFLNRCQSRSGSFYLWKSMRSPTRDIEVIKNRHRAIEFFLHVDNQNIFMSLKNYMQHVYRFPSTIINKYSTVQAKPSDWARFNTTLTNIINIAEVCGEYRNGASIFATIADSITEGIHYTRYFMNYIIDFESTKKHGKFFVKEGVDSRLDELNYIKQTLPQRMSEVVETELKYLPACVATCRIIYVPDIQYCLGITSWVGTPPEDEEIPGLEYKFTVNDIRYYKSNGTKELDEKIGDIAFQITKCQNQIMLRLINYINKNIGSILRTIEYCAELDMLLSFAQVAADHNYVKPEIVKAHIIDIKGGRHPLAELSGNFVANDTLSGNNRSLVKIFSGPNACGKTVYLKQVALLVYMTHIGSFLPVESAKIGLITHILTQMPIFETTLYNVSSFLLDLRQIHNILYSSTPNSLIIMDEFGKGTAEIDALALLTSILENFIDRKKFCPHIFAATHIHRVVELLPQNPIVETLTFEFLLDDDNSLVFLYRLIAGNSNSSFAHAVAKSRKIEKHVLENSINVFKCMKEGKLPAYKTRLDEFKVINYIVKNSSDGSNHVNLGLLKDKLKQAMIKRK